MMSSHPQSELTTFDKKVLDYIYNYPGSTARTIQLDFDRKYMITNTLHKLARLGLITDKNFKIYPVCNQVSL